MIPRIITSNVEGSLQRQAAVALIGPRQVGKTTLALEIGRARDALYLDLEDRDDRNRLAQPALFLDNVEDRLRRCGSVGERRPLEILLSTPAPMLRRRSGVTMETESFVGAGWRNRSSKPRGNHMRPAMAYWLSVQVGVRSSELNTAT